MKRRSFLASLVAGVAALFGFRAQAAEKRSRPLEIYRLRFEMLAKDPAAIWERCHAADLKKGEYFIMRGQDIGLYKVREIKLDGEGEGYVETESALVALAPLAFIPQPTRA